MSKYIYPAVFTPAQEGSYVVTFTDWGDTTQGDNKTDAIEVQMTFWGLACYSGIRRVYNT